MPSSERLNGFDALRAFVLLLGLVIHAAMPFLEPPVQVWAVIEPVRHVGLILVVMAIHAFRLQVFFLLSDDDDDDENDDFATPKHLQNHLFNFTS